MRLGALVAAVLLPGWALQAGIPVPAFSSRPGAPYTVYLNFGGFAFNGTWGETGAAPGVTPAYGTDGDPNNFSVDELANIKGVWSRVAQKYSAFNINVTTIDPAVAAGQAGDDTARQNYYDDTPQVMHTVIGGTGSWFGGGGVSYVGVIEDAWTGSNGFHTNWVFSAQAPSNRRFIAEAAAHEVGHALYLFHQSDYSGTSLVNEYSSNGGVTGDGSYAPTMGNSYNSQRGLWRTGSVNGENGKATQNDYTTIGNNRNITLVDSGIGHSIATATALPLIGTAINSSAAQGVITPTTLNDPVAIGVNNYTKDYFHFFSVGGSSTMTLFNGISTITPGAADPGATLDSTLKIYNNAGTLVATATRSGNTLSNSFTGLLPAGNYYAEVASIGGYTSVSDPTATYFTAGSYFLTGSNLYTRFNLVGQNLANTNLTSQTLTSANLTSASLAGATLTSANMTSANLTSANLASASLAGATLTSATLTNTSFVLADLRGATGFVPVGSTITRGAILTTGQVGTFTFNSAEVLRVRSNAITASVVGTVSGPASGTATVQVDAGTTLNLATPGVVGSSVRTLDRVALSVQGVTGQIATVRSTTITATAAMGRTLAPTLTVLSSISITSDNAPLGQRNYFGLLDLGTNDGVLLGSGLADRVDMARAFLDSGGTQGLGSSSTIPFTRLAVLENVSSPGVALFSTFDGLTVGTTDILMRLTYTGDTNLDGVLNGIDLANIVEGYSTAATGWQNGDLNYDSVVNLTDFSLFNAAYNAFLANPVSLGSPADVGAGGGGGAVIPEPAVGLLLGVPLMCLARRRR